MSRSLALILLILAALPTRALTAQADSASVSGALRHYSLRSTPAWRMELPDDLAEISGLAFAPDGALLAHGDERAVVWRIDPRARRVTGRFGLTGRQGILHGDFEDIAVVGERLFLVTSAGVIVEGRILPDGQSMQGIPRTQDLGGACEVEGLTWDAATRSLLLLCKTTRSKRWQGEVVILAVSVDTWKYEKSPRILVSEKHLARVTGEKRFHGSALTWHPRTGTLLLLAGPQQAYAEISRTGQVLGGGPLNKSRHRQPEGIAVAPDLTLLISDEAAGGRAAITAYAFHP